MLFADDVVLFSDTIVGLQRLLNCLESYCKTWKLSVNLAKTKIMVFKAGGYLSKAEKWFFNGKRVEVVSYYKYLGIMFSCRLIWSMATKTLAQQSRKAFMGIVKATRKIGMLPHNTFFKIFDTMILPILTYGSEVWGFEKHDSLERIHNYACRYFLGVAGNAPNVVVLGECGRYQIFLYTAKRCIKYWTKLLKMPQSRYPKKCYNMLYAIEKSGVRSKPTWVQH